MRLIDADKLVLHLNDYALQEAPFGRNDGKNQKEIYETTVLGNSIRNAVEKRFPWITVRKARKAAIIDRIRCTVRLMGAGRFWITDDCKSLQTAFSDAVWNKDVTDKDERLDDGSTDIDSLDAFEYTIERDMKDLIEEVEDV